jgi:hypothetical protein
MLNNVFKYFIKAARIKRAKFFCVVHDIESLRLGGQKKNLVSREAANLNYYDCLIVHNNYMRQWLKDKGITTKIVSLGLFDYLLKEAPTTNNNINLLNTVVFAGNLAKSNFIYSLSEIPNWNFNVYGPNYKANKQQSPNVVWGGEYSPEEVVYKLKGNFGLIWDGEKIDECDQVLGNYLRYNNPHKFSLYIAAGMPVIAPKDSAIAKIITDLKIGILVDSLIDLERLQLNESDYKVLQFNCRKVQNEIINGNFFLTAISAAEKLLAAS